MRSSELVGDLFQRFGEFQARAENALDYELPIATLFCDVHCVVAERRGSRTPSGDPIVFLPRRTGLDVLQDGEIEKTYRTYNISIPEMRWLQNPKRDLRQDS